MSTPSVSSILSTAKVSRRAVNVLSPEDRKNLAIIQHRAATTGGFVTLEYKDSKGNNSRKQFRFGTDMSKKYGKDESSRPVKSSNKANWVARAWKSGIRNSVLFYNKTVYVRGTCLASGEVRTLKLSGITNMVSQIS